MFDILFGWRKASKCKKLIKRVQCRLKLLKNKRNSIVKHLREDLAELIKLGYEETAFKRAEQLFKDESIMAVYDILDNFCEFVNLQLSYIRRNKDCPNDINEAVSSLIFASARCADLPELPAIRKLFGERYGQRFATAAVELLPGNLVNREIKEKLSIKSVSDDAKYRLVDEIVRDYCLKPEILAIEYIPEMEQPVKEISQQQELDRTNSNSEESQMQTSDANEIGGKSMQVDPLALNESSDGVCTSPSSCQQPSPEKLEPTIQIKAKKAENFPQIDSLMELTVDTPGDGKCQRISSISTNTLHLKDERRKAPSSSESLSQFSEDVVVYLDDIEELQTSKSKEGECQDQRLFKFKSPTLSKRGSNEGFDEGNMYQDELQDERSSSRAARKSTNSSGKRSRRRSSSVESLNMKDTDHELYYEKPCKSSPSHKNESYPCRKLQKNTTFAETERSDYMLELQKRPCRNCHFNSELNTCNSENPCCFFTGDDEEEQFPQKNQKRGLRNSEQQFLSCDVEESLEDQCSHCQYSGFIKMKEIDLAQNLRRRSYDNGPRVYEVFTMPKVEKEKAVGKLKESDSPGKHVSFFSVASSQTRKEAVGPYSRAMTMPQERPRESHTYSILRSNSLSFQNPNHVHPKLPDYDDIAAKFMALKKENVMYKRG